MDRIKLEMGTANKGTFFLLDGIVGHRKFNETNWTEMGGGTTNWTRKVDGLLVTEIAP